MHSNDTIRLSTLSNKTGSHSRTPSLDSQINGSSTPTRDVSHHNIRDLPPDFNNIDDGYDHDHDDSDEEYPDKMSLRAATDSHSGMPLLEKDDDRERSRPRRLDALDAVESRSTSVLPPPVVSASSANAGRPPLFPRSSTARSRSPDVTTHAAARKKYVLAAIFLVVCLVSFVLQAELGRYVQHELGWNKAYCMLYLTHGSWVLLWPAQLLILRWRSREIPWATFWRRHVALLRSTAHMVAEQRLDVPRHLTQHSPAPYIARTTAVITSCLTIAGLTWYIAVNMTSPGNLTAIYNCSAFFAYAFSVPLLKEKLRLDKSLAVLVAIVGVLVVAYGDSSDPDHALDAATRLLGNLIIGAGSVLYGLYEVLYKRYACPPDGVDATRGVVFANTFGSCIGLFTVLVLWIPLPILHILGWETFEFPAANTALYLWISVIMNATFAGSFLVLISLTSPVLSSVAALLTIFIVAVADWLLTGEALSFAALAGGAMIVVAFLVLSWSTWREMTEEEDKQKTAYREAPVDWDSDEAED
ncbi:hypothetical protein ANO14919_074970 [Xylariales sp. No.14919]|nr:hypothetical protein F5X98DRAFT_43100 [Xylaria grammica]GAW18028.1 hypothetical protein ANO14919_074970 [Xylariales sp. No.14919]